MEKATLTGGCLVFHSRDFAESLDRQGASVRDANDNRSVYVLQWAAC
jgi:hypothetical protein